MGRGPTARKAGTTLLLSFALLGCGGDDKPDSATVKRARLQTATNLRNIGGLCIVAEQLPMKDGTLDIYEFVRTGDVTAENYWIFRSPWRGGPSDGEIERGDYTNLPFGRYRGGGRLDPTKPVPLIWDKEPDPEGMFVVVFSDGVAKVLGRDDLEKAVGATERRMDAGAGLQDR